jgi:sodium transport system permease protein
MNVPMKSWAVFRKEITDGTRDRRALTMAFSFALLGPLMLIFIINFAASQQRDEALKPVSLCSGGGATELVGFLKSTGLVFQPGADLCLNIPGDYEQKLSRGEEARVAIRGDLTAGGPTLAKLDREIQAYSRQIGMRRAMARGMAPSAMTPVAIDRESSNPATRQANALGNVLVFYLVFAPFMLVAAMAADTSAGERERHSLEPLLSHAVSARDIVLGKFLSLFAVNVVGTSLCIAVALAALSRSAAPEIGLRLELSPATGMTLVLWLMPLCALVASAQLALGFLSRTFKDAQQTVMMFSLLPAVAGMVLLNRPEIEVGPWPLAWEMKALAGPLLGSTTSVPPFALTAGLEIGLTLLVLAFSAYWLKSGKAIS